MDYLVSDLNNIRQKCEPQAWQQEGRKVMKNAQMAHMDQRNFQYANSMQT